MSANEDFLDSLLKSVTDDIPEGNGNDIDMDSLLADIDSLDLGTLDLEALDLDTLGDFSEIGTTELKVGEDSDTSNLEEALTMTQEEIEQLLRETQAASVEDNEDRFDMDGDDLTQLLTGLDGEAGESGDEISELLQKADNNEVIDEEMADMMMQEEGFDDASDLFLASLGEEEEPKKKGLFGRKKKEKISKEKKPKEKKKSKKAKNQEEAKDADDADVYVETLEIVEPEKPEKPKKEKKAKKEKKSGLGSKFAALFAEDEADEILATLQEQNDAILIEMQEEDRANSKKAGKDKASKKDKKKKEKKEEKPKKEKKAKKEKKPKKEKLTPVELGEKEPAQYFPTKKAGTIVVVCIMLMAAFLVLNNVLANHSTGIQAVQAYNEERYMECYQLLIGQDMTEEQEKMFYRSELILQMRLFKQHCNEFLSAGQELEAVDKLVQFVYDYKNLLQYATKHECVDIVESTYAEVVAVLQTYGVTAEDAIDIAEEITDKDYTKALLRVVEGTNQKQELKVEPIFKDMLPEEEARQP